MCKYYPLIFPKGQVNVLTRSCPHLLQASIEKKSSEESSSNMDSNKAIGPKPELLDFELPSETICPRQLGVCPRF